MQIGLFTGAITSATPAGTAGGSQQPQGLTPIPGILDAPNVIVMGASIMQSAFGSGYVLDQPIADYAAAAGFTGTLHTRAQGGEATGATAVRQADVATEPGLAATQGQNLYLVHTGGNNVSPARPWPGGQEPFTTDYNALMANITGAGDKVIPMPLTKRLYPDAPAVIHGDAASEANGSKPYNENIIHPAIAQYAPDWRNGTADPFVNPYELAHRYPQLVSSDGVHGYGASIARYILARVAGRARGEQKTDSRAGTSLLYSTEIGEPNTMSIGPVNRFRCYANANFQNHPLLAGAVRTDGSFDPFITLLTSGQAQNGSNNAGTGTFARIPDSRFHDADLVNNGVYVQGSLSYNLHFDDLVPGDTVTITAVGVRGAGGTNRRGLVTLSTGQPLELDAANDAPSNQIVFDPVTVPANGSITLSLTVAPGSTYGYLHGVALDFS